MGAQVLSSGRPCGLGQRTGWLFVMAAPHRLGPQHKPVDHVGRRYSRLKVVRLERRAPRVRGFMYFWFCKCDCGGGVVARSSHLTSGAVKSCGCLRASSGGMTISHKYEYQSWHNMIGRCENPRHVKYRYYGARGIKVCKRWHDFRLFVADMGRRPVGHTLDREDTNDDYRPGNCRWATHLTQRHNRRDSLG